MTRHITDAEADELAAWFDAQVANCPRTWGPTHADVMRSAAADANVSALIRRMHPTDAARQAAHGYDIERELAEVGPEPSDVCDQCGGSGWYDIDEWSIECDCEVS